MFEEQKYVWKNKNIFEGKNEELSNLMM